MSKPAKGARRGRRWFRRGKKTKKSRLGLWTGLALGLLILAYAGALEVSRPHVSGDRLRFDSFIKAVGDGRVRDAKILDEDAFVVGFYVAPTAEEEAAATPPPAFGTGSAHEHGPSSLAEASTEEAPEPVSGPSRPYNTPLVRGTQVPLLDLLLQNNVPIEVDQQVGKRVASLAGILLPGLILVVLFIYLILSYRYGTGLFGLRSGARQISPEEATVRFSDVAGQDAAVAELREVKEFLANPGPFVALGAQVPKGILLYGPPGCGKTLLAKALAGESGAAFFSISGSDFVEMYVGVGAARVREFFAQAREQAPAIIFIDELDSIGRARGTVGNVTAHGEQEQALNQILAEMDGFSASEGVVVVAATNRPDILDQALLRPGRFDRTVGLERPDEAARLAILGVHVSGKPLAENVDLAELANRAIGLTGADLAAVVNEGALLAARKQEQVITQPHLNLALQRILEAPDRQRRLSLRERSVARRHTGGDRVTFSDVAGVDDALAELADVRDYLREPERFTEMGARVPRGILMSGPPGCGKTLLARAVAGEANAAFFSVAASEFVEVFVGQGAARVRELFAESRSVAPAIVFIDEIDAIGARRGGGMDGGHREVDQTLNQILVELDGFEPQSAVIVMAATNRPDILDTALVRPGRFDRHVAMSLPDRAGRSAILEIHARSRRLAADVDLDVVASLTRGFSGADLAGVLNEATLLATRQRLSEVPMALVEEGIDRSVMGVASRGTLLSEQERALVAYHEAGHAVVASALPGAAVPHKLTVVPRGNSTGHCAVVESHDKVVRSESDLIDHMAVLLGGRVAEELVFRDRATGSAADLERVSELAWRMVCEFGMSEALGPMRYDGAGGGDGRWGRSEEEARNVYAEARRFVEQAEGRAQAVLISSREALDRVAAALLERETLRAAELAAIMSHVETAEPARVAR